MVALAKAAISGLVPAREPMTRAVKGEPVGKHSWRTILQGSAV